jgi:hypothetical protein
MKIGCQYMYAEYSLFSEESVIETAILISLLMQCIATLFRNFVGGLV